MKKLAAATVVLAAFLTPTLVFATPGQGKGQGNSNKATVITFDQINTKPTEWGREVEDLRAYNGKIYAGYGDWNANGRINLQIYDPTSGSVETGPQMGNAVHHMIEYGGKLFAAGPESGGVHIFDNVSWIRGNAWVHEFGVVEHQGVIYVAGQTGAGATVLASYDGGITYERVFSTTDTLRFHSIFVLNNKMYVVDYGDGYVYDFDTGVWTPVRIASGLTMMYRAENFGDYVIGLDWYPTGGTGHGPLHAFDGVSSRYVCGCIDFTIDGEWLYTLNTTGEVRRTVDLVNWESVVKMKGPSHKSPARSVEILDGHVYIGATDGQMYIY